MSKIVFFCIPAHGHINPTLGVVKDLISRGHQVWYYSYNMMRKKIEDTGATFVSCDEYDSNFKLSAKDISRMGKDLAFSTKVLVDTTLAFDDKILNEIENLEPDCIVADSMALWGKTIALKLSVPFVSSTTTFAFNKHSAKIMKQGIGELFNMFISMGEVSKQIERLKEKGYPVNSILDIIGNDENTHTIVYTSPEFQPCYETFSDKFSFVGPSIRSGIDEIKKSREILVYISMGTVNNDMMPFYKSCISAFKDTPYQVIMSVGEVVDINEFGNLPDNISVFSQIDQIAVLEKADIFVSHCGMNSVSESLYFEVPLIMVPKTTEQKGVATRIKELGAGLYAKRINGISIYNAVEKVLCNEKYKMSAKEISKSFKNSLGVKGAADKIIKVCNNEK